MGNGFFVFKIGQKNEFLVFHTVKYLFKKIFESKLVTANFWYTFLKKDILRYEIPKIHFLTDFENEDTAGLSRSCTFRKKNGVNKGILNHCKPQNSKFFSLFLIFRQFLDPLS